MDIARLIRQARAQKGLSQAQLALRAGTSQAAISKIERGQNSPSIDTVERLLLVMGERLAGLQTEPLERDYDPVHMQAELQLAPSERVERAMRWMTFNEKLTRAGKAAQHAK